jgi:hypothetical protein
MSKSKPARPQDAAAEQVHRARRSARLLLQRLEQVAVLAAQVEKALARADGEAGDGHALEHQVGVAAAAPGP